MKVPIFMLLFFSSIFASFADQISQVSYGKITNVQVVELRSRGAGGAAVGGTIAGLGANEHKAGWAAFGAVAGRSLQKAATSGQTANKYTVQLENGSTVIVTSAEKGMAVGDCVAVTVGASTTIKRVDGASCEQKEESPATASQNSTPAATEALSPCDQAKQELLNAKTKEEVDLASEKVKALCGD